MLLCIDVGNTQTVLGLYERSVMPMPQKLKAGDGLVEHFRVATRAESTSDESALLYSELFSMRGIKDFSAVEAVIISSTVPATMTSLHKMVTRWFRLEPVVLTPALEIGLRVLYDNPKEVGADRLADAVAAFELYGGPTVVVDFGTATTFDVISPLGEYLGGAIAPGVEISMDALYNAAAALRKVELKEPKSVIGKSTVESIQSGALYGFAAQADGICTRIEAELGECVIVATGGLCSVIAPYSTKIQYIEPWLTLHGLRLIYERNFGS